MCFEMFSTIPSLRRKLLGFFIETALKQRRGTNIKRNSIFLSVQVFVLSLYKYLNLQPCLNILDFNPRNLPLLLAVTLCDLLYLGTSMKTLKLSY